MLFINGDGAAFGREGCAAFDSIFGADGRKLLYNDAIQPILRSQNGAQLVEKGDSFFIFFPQRDNF